MDNPPAFPLHPQVWIPGSQYMTDDERAALWSGMTLRDWFAGQALSGFDHPYRHPTDDAKKAYAIAEAMLAERARLTDTDLAKHSAGQGGGL